MSQYQPNPLPEWVKTAILEADTSGRRSPFPPQSPLHDASTEHTGIHLEKKSDEQKILEEDSQERARLLTPEQASQPIREAVWELARADCFSEAYRLVRADLARHPEHFFPNLPELFFTALPAERYDEAEAIYLRYVSGGGCPIQAYVGLSLAVAGQGKLYPGQAEYSGQALRQAYGGSPLEGRLSPKWTKPKRVEDVAVACRLALGNSWPAPFNHPLLEHVLASDPACEVAALLLADGYGWTERKADALRVLGIAIEHATSVAGRDELVAIRDQVEAEGRYSPTPRAYLPTSSLNDRFLKED